MKKLKDFYLTVYFKFIQLHQTIKIKGLNFNNYFVLNLKELLIAISQMYFQLTIKQYDFKDILLLKD